MHRKVIRNEIYNTKTPENKSKNKYKLNKPMIKEYLVRDHPEKVVKITGLNQLLRVF